jgi:hypothetical protein
MGMGKVKVAAALVGLALIWPEPARAQSADWIRSDEYTAFTVPGGDLKLGLLSFEYGITDRFSIGTDPPAWAAGAYVQTWAPNLHVKYSLVAQERWRLSGQVGAYFADISTANSGAGNLVVVPLTALGSVALADRWWLHLEGNYNFLEVSGTGNVQNLDIEGALSTESFHVGAMLEFRPIPRLALTVRGRSQVWMQPVVVSGSDQVDPYTRVDLAAEVEPPNENPYTAVASVSYFWRHVQARLGVGYGFYFVTAANVYLPYQGVVPDASLAVVF